MTNRLAALAARRPDLSLANITIPTTDAAPTRMVIAISTGEKCPPKKVEMPNRYAQIRVISNNQNKNGAALPILSFSNAETPERR